MKEEQNAQSQTVAEIFIKLMKKVLSKYLSQGCVWFEFWIRTQQILT